MVDCLLVFLLIFNQILFLNCNNEFTESILEQNKFQIEPGLSKTYFIEYQQDTNFTFNIKEGDSLQINIHAINCNFEIVYYGELLNKINLDTYSLKIDSQNKFVIIKPLIDVIDGQYRENYAAKNCPLSINSYLIKDNQAKLKIENKEENIFYLLPSEYQSLTISYDINKITSDSFVSLYFQFNEKTNFLLNITYKNVNNEEKKISKLIDSANNIFLDSEFLWCNGGINEGGNLTIHLLNIDKKSINMYFKIIEKFTISYLEKNALNFGFLTSKTTHQFYYTEILMGEEGEIMLHNKRISGVLYAKIIDKNETIGEHLNDTAIFPYENIDESGEYLTYNSHSLQLKYSYENTSHCFNGCYLLITYEQIQSEGDFPLIGYEFTILTRSWNFTDYIPQIVDIPLNEYIIGAFEKGSISHHYYSISVPDDADKIIIQLEGNYLDGFYGEGRQKINTAKTIGKTNKLQIISNTNVLTLNIKELNYKDKTMSFAFRPKDYYADIFSFYYFRILYVRENETLYFPIDSHLGNLCLPEMDKNSTLYYCNLILKNNYNALSTNFTISSSVQNEYFKINTTKVYINGDTENTTSEFIHFCNDSNKNITHYLFKLEFRNNEIKNIITSFFDKVQNYFPQIYSPQMFYLDLIEKTNNFKLKNNYTYNHVFIFGSPVILYIHFLHHQNISTSRNFKGKPVSLPIDSKTEKITLKTEGIQCIFYFQLIYNAKNKVVEEVKSGETKSQFLKTGSFPLYYYLKIKNQNYINLDVNLRINSYNETVLKNNFDVKGYLLDEDSINRKINGEYIKLNEAIDGNYSNTFKVGLLQVNKKIEDKKHYLLIEIQNQDLLYFDSILLVELVTKEYNDDDYFLPINQYILETFDGDNGEVREKNKYYLSSKQKDTDQAFIEISPGFNDIEIKFEDSCNANVTFDFFKGFKKYRVYSAKDDNVYFSVINPKKRRDANYMIRYFYTGLGGEYIYTLDENPKMEIISSNDESVSIALTFNSMKIHQNKTEINRTDIYFFIYGRLFHMDNNSEEQLNTTCFLTEQKPLYENKTIHNYNYYYPEKWTLIFKNIPRYNNFNYDLQLQVNAILENNIFNEEFLIFKSKINLEDIKLEEEKTYTWIIVGSVLGFLVLIVVIFFIIKYIRLHKKNKNLEEEMKSLAYSNDVQKNVLIKEKKSSQHDSDYETTFI